MKHLKLECGFELDVDPNVFDDMELFDMIAEMDGGNALALSRVTAKILGGQKAALYDHLRTPAGNVPVEAVTAAVIEIFQKGASKNS